MSDVVSLGLSLGSEARESGPLGGVTDDCVSEVSALVHLIYDVCPETPRHSRNGRAALSHLTAN